MPLLTRSLYLLLLLLLCTRVPAQGLRLTDTTGTFVLAAVPPGGTVTVSFLGLATRRVEDVRTGALGTIVLRAADGHTLDQVVVTGRRSTTEFRLDKRVFNVGKDLSSSGASALEVLNNVPSVTVSIEGQVRLRGSGGVQILIDGKPSVLTGEGGNALGTLTADMIERVEVITNPAANYEAAGTAGILNIVLKTDEQRGLSGSVSVNTGTPHNHSLGLSVHRRSDRLRLFGQFGGGYRTFPRTDRSVNRNLIAGTTVSSSGAADKNEQFYNLILGADYHLGARGVLTLSGYLAYEFETERATTTFRVQDPAGRLTDAWDRDEATTATNPKWQYELSYTQPFGEAAAEGEEEHALTVTALGSSFAKDQASSFTTVLREGQARYGDQRTRTDFAETEYTLRADYTRPLTTSVTVMTGLQYAYSDTGNDFAVSDLVGGTFREVTALTNRFDFDQGVLAGYATGTYERERWGAKVGLRAEKTQVQTFLHTTQQRDRRGYANLFPSLHASYRWSDAVSVQAGYSRRIDRPGLWSLNPFYSIRNNFNVTVGNPELLPEFTDAYELTAVVVAGDALSGSAALYHRFTTDVVEDVNFFEDEVNVRRPVNLGHRRDYGLELSGKYTPAAWFTLSGDANYTTFVRRAALAGVRYVFRADRLTGRLVARLALPLGIDLELAGNLRSGYRSVQGRVRGYAFADAGLRKKVLAGRMILDLSVRDVFVSRVYAQEVRQPEFSVLRSGRRARYVTVGLSYGFGKGEAMEFGGEKRF